MFLCRFIRLLAIALVLPLACTTAEAQARRALIIGNAQYQDLPDLQNTIDDANAYKDTFAKLGYQISFYHDLDLDGFAEAVDSFAASIQSGDTVVVVYTGHGWSDGRENFLIPTDAPVSGSETKLRGASFPLRDGQNGLLDLIDAAGASLSVAIIDACRNNPFTAKAGTRSVGYSRGLAPVSAPNGSFVIFSAGEGQEALDRLPDDPPEEKLSVFTRNLAPLLQSGAYLEDAIAEAQLETATMAATVDGHLQHPAYYDQTLGKTCLAARCQDLDTLASNTPTPAQPPAQPPARGVDEQNPLILACDTAAQNGGNPDNPNGVAGVPMDQIDGPSAESACAAAVAQFPDHLRSVYNLARVKAALGQDAAALGLYQGLAGKQYPAGIFGLADAYQYGKGISANPGLALRTYDVACKANHQTSCAIYGDMLFRGEGVAADQTQGLRLLQQGCAANSGYACELAAYALQSDATRKAEVPPLFQKACDLGNETGCAQQAYLQVGQGDFTAARQNYQTACDRSLGWACRELGLMAKNGQGGPADPQLAATLYEKGCALKDGLACTNRGWMFFDVADHANANPYFEKACALKEGSACTNLGFQKEKGNGAAPDLQEALRLYEQGCDYGNGTGCDNVAGLHFPPSVAGDDAALSLSFYKRGCDLDTPASCRSAGMIIFDGTVSAADQTLGLTYLQKSCDLKWGQGCNTLGNYLEKQRSTAPEVNAKIATAYTQGCDLGWGNACADLALGYQYERFGQSKDEAKARALFQSGCEKPDSAYACDRLAASIHDKKDAEVFVDAALKACDGGFGDRCAQLALFDYGPAKPRAPVDLLVQALQVKSTLPKANLSSLDRGQIVLLQQALGQLGLYKGAADGKRGPATVAALEAVYTP